MGIKMVEGNLKEKCNTEEESFPKMSYYVGKDLKRILLEAKKSSRLLFQIHCG